MKILILGSVSLPVPPIFQGGTERIAYYQAKGLAQKGHQVTLVAARGSNKSLDYNIVEIGGGDTVIGTKNINNSSIDLQPLVESSRLLRKEMVYLSEVANWLSDHQDEYELIVNNMRGGELLFHMLALQYHKKYLTVMHLPIFAELAELFAKYHTPIVTISNSQRQQFPDLNYIGTVYNGVDLKYFPFEKTPRDYLLMMGSIAPHKNQKAGIEAAKALGMTLKIAGKIGNPAYYDAEIAPHVDGQKIILIGEIGMPEKVKLYQGARALLFPVLWEEPFGLVMIESMACGTPVIAYRRGAVPEVVIDGKTGFIVDDENAMIESIKKVGEIDRADCRGHVEENFTVEKMMTDLNQIIQKL